MHENDGVQFFRAPDPKPGSHLLKLAVKPILEQNVS